jgi:two-component system phosphate regulon response regulator PhoB
LTHVLIIESNRALETKLKQTLERPGGVYVGTASTLREALSETNSAVPDFIVIDFNGAVIDGFEVTRVLRSRQNVRALPVIILQQRGLADGGQDAESTIDEAALRKKLNQVLNPSQSRQLDAWTLDGYRDDRLTAEFTTGSFWVDGCPVDLAAREQELLRVLIEQARRVVTRRELHDRLWGYETRSLDVHVRRLRRNLGASGHQIETVRGLGYRFLPCGAVTLTPLEQARHRTVTARR